MKNAKTEKSLKYLSSCLILEGEAHSLYTLVSKKLELDHPVLSIITIAIAQDCFKHSQVIHELLKSRGFNVDLNQCNKDLREVWNEIHNCSAELTNIGTISDEALPGFLETLVDLEDCFHEIYSTFLNSRVHEASEDNLSLFPQVTPENLSFIIECLKEENYKHRDMLIQGLYFFNKSRMQSKGNPPPIVKYQNPDAWINV